MQAEAALSDLSLGRAVRREAVRNRRYNGILRNKVRDLALSDPRMFVVGVLGYKFEDFHEQWFRFQAGNPRTILLAPRGHGKTKIADTAYVLWRLAQDQNLRVLIASKTSRQAVLFLNEIKQHMEANQEFRWLFGDWVEDSEWQDVQIRIPRTLVAKEPTITTVGMGGSLPTWHFDLIVLDDPHDLGNSRTNGQRELVWKWFEQTCLPTLEPTGEIHLIGTRWHADDLFGRLMAKREESGVERYKVMVSRALDSSGVALWPEMFSVDALKELKNEMGATIFALQYLCDTELGALSGPVFDAEKFFVVPESVAQEMAGNPTSTVVQAWDLATGEAEVVGRMIGDAALPDYTVCVTIVLTADNRFVVVDWTRGRIGLTEQIERIKSKAAEYKPDEVGIEAVAYQAAVSKHLKRTTTLPIRPLRPRAGEDKFRRAWGVQPYVDLGRVGISQRCLGLRDVLAAFPYGEEDDSVDAFVYALTMLARREYLYGKRSPGRQAQALEGV